MIASLPEHEASTAFRGSWTRYYCDLLYRAGTRRPLRLQSLSRWHYPDYYSNGHRKPCICLLSQPACPLVPPPHISERFTRNKQTYSPQARVADMQEQSMCSQIMSCWKYLTSAARITTPFVIKSYGNGTYWRVYAKDGDKSYLSHHTVSISKYSAPSALLSGRISISGQPFLWYSKSGIPPDDEDNVIAALEHRDRLCSIMLVVADLQLEKMTKAMHEPSLVLNDLFISSADGNALALPAEFLGGSAPCLQRITLCGIRYRRFFCPPVTSSPSNFTVYPQLVTIYLGRWLRVWPHCPCSPTLSLNLDPRRLLRAMTEYPCLP
ncbi:hypothetical protein EDB87DRAFT_1187070 [Lactarius vividus]|nr:hypothetical protein EDB87DRAFT_1187070 [Lactarius vividus]